MVGSIQPCSPQAFLVSGEENSLLLSENNGETVKLYLAACSYLVGIFPILAKKLVTSAKFQKFEGAFRPFSYQTKKLQNVQHFLQIFKVYDINLLPPCNHFTSKKWCFFWWFLQPPTGLPKKKPTIQRSNGHPVTDLAPKLRSATAIGVLPTSHPFATNFQLTTFAVSHRCLCAWLLEVVDGEITPRFREISICSKWLVVEPVAMNETCAVCLSFWVKLQKIFEGSPPSYICIIGLQQKRSQSG